MGLNSEDQLEKSDISNFNTVMPIPLMFGAQKKNADDDEDDEDEEEPEKSKISRKSKSGLDKMTVTSRKMDDDEEGVDFMERAAEFGGSDQISASTCRAGASCFWSSTRF